MGEGSLALACLYPSNLLRADANDVGKFNIDQLLRYLCAFRLSRCRLRYFAMHRVRPHRTTDALALATREAS